VDECKALHGGTGGDGAGAGRLGRARAMGHPRTVLARALPRGMATQTSLLTMSQDAITLKTFGLMTWRATSVRPSAGAHLLLLDWVWGRGLHSFTFQLNRSGVRHTKSPYTP
jgi:hypothetical protein